MIASGAANDLLSRFRERNAVQAPTQGSRCSNPVKLPKLHLPERDGAQDEIVAPRGGAFDARQFSRSFFEAPMQPPGQPSPQAAGRQMQPLMPSYSVVPHASHRTPRTLTPLDRAPLPVGIHGVPDVLKLQSQVDRIAAEAKRPLPIENENSDREVQSLSELRQKQADLYAFVRQELQASASAASEALDSPSMQDVKAPHPPKEPPRQGGSIRRSANFGAHSGAIQPTDQAVAKGLVNFEDKQPKVSDVKFQQEAKSDDILQTENSDMQKEHSPSPVLVQNPGGSSSACAKRAEHEQQAPSCPGETRDLSSLSTQSPSVNQKLHPSKENNVTSSVRVPLHHGGKSWRSATPPRSANFRANLSSSASCQAKETECSNMQQQQSSVPAEKMSAPVPASAGASSSSAAKAQVTEYSKLHQYPHQQQKQEQQHSSGLTDKMSASITASAEASGCFARALALGEDPVRLLEEELTSAVAAHDAQRIRRAVKEALNIGVEKSVVDATVAAVSQRVAKPVSENAVASQKQKEDSSLKTASDIQAPEAQDNSQAQFAASEPVPAECAASEPVPAECAASEPVPAEFDVPEPVLATSKDEMATSKDEMAEIQKISTERRALPDTSVVETDLVARALPDTPVVETGLVARALPDTPVVETDLVAGRTCQTPPSINVPTASPNGVASNAFEENRALGTELGKPDTPPLQTLMAASQISPNSAAKSFDEIRALGTELGKPDKLQTVMAASQISPNSAAKSFDELVVLGRQHPNASAKAFDEISAIGRQLRNSASSEKVVQPQQVCATEGRTNSVAVPSIKEQDDRKEISKDIVDISKEISKDIVEDKRKIDKLAEDTQPSSRSSSRSSNRRLDLKEILPDNELSQKEAQEAFEQLRAAGAQVRKIQAMPVVPEEDALKSFEELRMLGVRVRSVEEPSQDVEAQIKSSSSNEVESESTSAVIETLKSLPPEATELSTSKAPDSLAVVAAPSAYYESQVGYYEALRDESALAHPSVGGMSSWMREYLKQREKEERQERLAEEKSRLEEKAQRQIEARAIKKARQNAAEMCNLPEQGSEHESTTDNYVPPLMPEWLKKLCDAEAPPDEDGSSILDSAETGNRDPARSLQNARSLGASFAEPAGSACKVDQAQVPARSALKKQATVATPNKEQIDQNAEIMVSAVATAIKAGFGSSVPSSSSASSVQSHQLHQLHQLSRKGPTPYVPPPASAAQSARKGSTPYKGPLPSNYKAKDSTLNLSSHNRSVESFSRKQRSESESTERARSSASPSSSSRSLALPANYMKPSNVSQRPAVQQTRSQQPQVELSESMDERIAKVQSEISRAIFHENLDHLENVVLEALDAGIPLPRSDLMMVENLIEKERLAALTGHR